MNKKLGERGSIMSSLTKVSILVAVCLALAVPGYARQNESQLSGTVKDPAGATLTGAKVVARHQTTGQSKETTTDSQGRYELALAPGPTSTERNPSTSLMNARSASASFLSHGPR
jgi:hypothetical protein